MRRSVFLLVAATFLASAVGTVAACRPALAEAAAHSKTVVLRVDGMTCPLCKNAVEKALSSVAGVEQSDVNPSAERAVVIVRPDVQPGALAAAITAAGYPAHLLEVR